jgi:hypothetical protein
MISRSKGLTYKGLAILILLVSTVVSLSLITTANTGMQSRQASNSNNTTKENAPAAWPYWARGYGGRGGDAAYCVQNTTDGGYIVAGCTNSFGAGGCDFWVLKLDSNGGVDWQKTYGGGDEDMAFSVQQTSDGGYIVAGQTSSFDEPWNWHAWILKLDSNGGVDWQKTYGGTHGDAAYSVHQTNDGGYIVAGVTDSFGSGGSDFWVLKLNSTGGVDWQNAYGGSSTDIASYAQQTADGGYITAGTTMSFGAGDYDFWVVKLGTNGSVTWGPGNGAATTRTSVIPANSSATASPASITPLDSDAVVKETNAAPQATGATLTMQSPFTIGVPPPGLPTTTIIAAILGVGLLIVLTIVVYRRKSEK